MRFQCERCGKRFSTTEEPVEGRVYRIPCRCGNTVVLCGGAPQARTVPLPVERKRSAPPLPRSSKLRPSAASPQGDCELEARSFGSPLESAVLAAASRASTPVLAAAPANETAPTPAVPARVARRDPDGCGDPGWVPLEWARRRERDAALAAGLGGGAVAAVAFLAGLAIGTPGTVPTATAVASRAEAEVVAVVPGGGAPSSSAPTPPASTPTETARAEPILRPAGAAPPRSVLGQRERLPHRDGTSRVDRGVPAGPPRDLAARDAGAGARADGESTAAADRTGGGEPTGAAGTEPEATAAGPIAARDPSGDADPVSDAGPSAGEGTRAASSATPAISPAVDSDARGPTPLARSVADGIDVALHDRTAE